MLGDREGEKGWVSLWGWGTPVLLRVDLGTPKCFQNASGSCGRALQALSSKAVPAASPSTAGLWDSAAAAARHRRAFSGLPLLALPGRILFLAAAAFGGFSWDVALCTRVQRTKQGALTKPTHEQMELHRANPTQLCSAAVDLAQSDGPSDSSI